MSLMITDKIYTDIIVDDDKDDERERTYELNILH